MATKDHDDFTFPATTTDSPPRFLDSPPLWRRREESKGKEVEERASELRSSGAEERRNCEYSNDEEDGEEKMDLLWEDLNEDQFARNCEKFVQSSSEVKAALKLSKRNGRIVSGKKTSILVFIKILKKVFLMHNFQRAMKKKKKTSSW